MSELESRDPDPDSVCSLFHTCLVNDFDPDVAFAAVRVLEHLGIEVSVPLDQTCCGQPAFNAGFHDEARAVARHTLRVLDATTGPIVIPSGSCADMLVHQYPVLFEDEPAMLEVARRVAARCREFSQFLAEVAPGGHRRRAVPHASRFILPVISCAASACASRRSRPSARSRASNR